MSTSIQNMLSARCRSVLVKCRLSQPAVVLAAVLCSHLINLPPRSRSETTKQNVWKENIFAAALQRRALEQLVLHILIALHDAHRLLLLPLHSAFLSLSFISKKKAAQPCQEGRRRLLVYVLLITEKSKNEKLNLIQKKLRRGC